MHDTSVFNANSPQAQAIANLFYVDLVIAAGILTIVATLIALIVVRFRARPGAAEPRQDPGNARLETLWTVLPAMILGVLAVLTARTMQQVDPPVGLRAPSVVVTAHQWWWEYRYPGSGVVTANELHMKAGENWLLALGSADVIHDFWVPDLGAKVDCIPGRESHLWIQPHREGVYLGTCGEYCGADHAMMGIRVIVESPAAFEGWTREQLRTPPPPVGAAAQRGARLFEDKTCSSCHRVAGTRAMGAVGPDLTHVGSRQTLGAGVRDNNLANLTAWVEDPQKIKPGCHMPNMRLTHAEAQDVATYLEALK